MAAGAVGNRTFDETKLQVEGAPPFWKIHRMARSSGNLAEGQPGAEGDGVRIVLIDDDGNFLTVVTRFLQQLGYEVFSASSGEEGIQLAIECAPQLVLCDLEMPRMDGHEVLRGLRQHPAVGDVPFIFLTGQSKPEHVRAGMNLGADDYLAKPFEGEELIAAVRARLARSRSRTAAPSPTAVPASEDKQLGLDDSVLVKTNSDIKPVKVAEIRAILADGEYSWLHSGAANGTLIRKTLKQWEQELPARHFVRIHRGSIINLNHISRIDKADGQMTVFIRELAEPLEVSLRLAPVLNRKLKAFNR